VRKVAYLDCGDVVRYTARRMTRDDGVCALLKEYGVQRFLITLLEFYYSGDQLDRAEYMVQDIIDSCSTFDDSTYESVRSLTYVLVNVMSNRIRGHGFDQPTFPRVSVLECIPHRAVLFVEVLDDPD
jgi:hypothetical protein